MVNLTLEQWQHQSSLLVQARPTTTRIITKYNVPNLESAKYQRNKKRKREPEADGKDAAPRIPTATLTLKTFDPESGVALQFKTDRAADAGRLISGLGRLGKQMAALPEETEDVVMHEPPPSTREGQGSTEDVGRHDSSLSIKEGLVSTDASSPAAAAAEKSQQQQQSGAGKKKKKKGKK